MSAVLHVSVLFVLSYQVLDKMKSHDVDLYQVRMLRGLINVHTYSLRIIQLKTQWGI